METVGSRLSISDNVGNPGTANPHSYSQPDANTVSHPNCIYYSQRHQLASFQLPQEYENATEDDVIIEDVENQTDAIVVQQDENVHFNSNPDDQNNDENGQEYIYETEDVHLSRQIIENENVVIPTKIGHQTIALTNEVPATQTNKFLADYYDEITYTEDSVKTTDIPVFGHNDDTSEIMNFSNTPLIHIEESTADFPVDTQIQHEEIQNFNVNLSSGLNEEVQNSNVNLSSGLNEEEVQNSNINLSSDEEVQNSNIDLSSGLNDDTEEFNETFASILNPPDENAFLQNNDDNFPYNLQFTNPSFHTAANMFLGDEATDVHSVCNPDQVTHALVSNNNSHQSDDQVVSDTPMIEPSINSNITEYSPIEPPAVLDLPGFQGLSS